MSLAAFDTLLTGVLYVVLVDKPFERAVGVGGALFSNPRIVNALWAMIGVTYSALMVYLVYISVRQIKTTSEPSAWSDTVVAGLRVVPSERRARQDTLDITPEEAGLSAEDG